jgi:hypothetical protein
MTAAVIAGSVCFWAGAWAGSALCWHRLGSRRRHLTEWEADLRYQQGELARLFDVVADERRQINRGCGR